MMKYDRKIGFALKQQYQWGRKCQQSTAAEVVKSTVYYNILLTRGGLIVARWKKDFQDPSFGLNVRYSTAGHGDRWMLASRNIPNNSNKCSLATSTKRFITMRMEVWYKLNDHKVDAVDVPEGLKVRNLKDAIKAKWPELKDIAAARLEVFVADPNTCGTREIQPYDPIPTNTTGQNPLVVVARQQQQQAPQLSQLIEAMVAEHLRDWSKAYKRPALPTFEISEDAALRCYWKGNETGVPALIGNKTRPSLLLHDLQNEEHKETSGYKYIDESQKIGPIALYGTSGAGKTRTIFEYLSHNYGFYLSAAADQTINPGSKDVVFLIQHCSEVMSPIPHDSANSKELSEENLRYVQTLLKALLFVRTEVFRQIDTALSSRQGGRLSCYEWLIIQLFPSDVLGCDIFLDVLREIVSNKSQYSMDGVPVPKLERQNSCFMDEAQVLLKKLNGVFLSTEGTDPRSAYSAFLKGLTNLQLTAGTIHYPCFSGTGMSIEAYKAAANSLMVKPNLHDHLFYFVGLKTMSRADVIQYIGKFLDLSKVKDDLVNHVGDWLKGRPRWVATFIETYIESKQTKSKREPRGSFEDAEQPLIKSLNRYIEVCTANPEEEGTMRFSWSLKDKSAFAAVSRMFEKKGIEWFEAQEAFRKATFDFSFGGERQRVKRKASDMIEAGVASVDLQDKDSDFVEAVIGEPLAVQASITYFGLQDSISTKVASTTSSSEMGKVFEEFLLPSIQTRFQKILRSQVGQDSSLVDFMVPEWSSYGVLATRCGEKPAATIAWINAAVKARFEGAVAPFCFPDTLFGPDVAFLMRTHDWSDFRFVALQAKLKLKLNQAEALRTVVPALFYHENRDSKPSSSLKDAQLHSLWKKAEEDLFGIEQVDITPEGKNQVSMTGRKRKRDMVRVMVQYPADKTKSANPGPIPHNVYRTKKQCKEGKCNCPEHDHLITINVNNSKELFGPKGVELLKLVEPTEDSS
ncbi:hypothetical protein IV203_030143 [Nitzschia inconspicua]|uniref:Uncharacterized protein n=1 Tax=Nitzschia inconspicua TaxID=303405 RepID=A0A9K3LSJ4_9STRA|nr:hypothetical protein IV203_004903 [Nitzschia inconspicua]KAG7367472.1 hypothetical protein IV203_030143 [Nitzschia inconspicua]